MPTRPFSTTLWGPRSLGFSTSQTLRAPTHLPCRGHCITVQTNLGEGERQRGDGQGLDHGRVPPPVHAQAVPNQGREEKE